MCETEIWVEGVGGGVGGRGVGGWGGGEGMRVSRRGRGERVGDECVLKEIKNGKCDI